MTLRAFQVEQVNALGILQFGDDLGSRSEQAPRYLSARQEQRAEPAQRNEEPRAEAVPEECGGGKVVHLARDDRAHKQRIDQVIR